MGHALHLGCRCGAVRLTVSAPGGSAGTRVMCYCKDCQTSARHLRAVDMLDSAGGSDIYQTTPDRLTLRAGQDQLRIQRLSPKGLLRWYAGCCDTPLFNTLPRLGLPFVGVLIPPVQAEQATPLIGPVVCRSFTASATPGRGAPAQDSGMARAGLGIVTRMIAAAVSGRARHSPLRAADGGPIAPVTVLRLEQRQAARPT
ncbi:MAG: hypothetical protein KDK26_01965 [Roseivivax sp.]|nr:hypothetical protein [Roseivivax sp.]